MSLLELKKDLKEVANPAIAKHLQRYFKTGKGQYGEGDIFLGIKVPNLRLISKRYHDISIEETSQLIDSPLHEERMSGLFILINKFKKGNESCKSLIFELYLSKTDKINNWDLVDLSAPSIVGEYLLSKDYAILLELAKSNHLWKKRIAIISTLRFIKEGIFNPSIEVSLLLLHDKHDLIQKGVGWMLREIGKRNFELEEAFLQKHYKNMPRTMLRYAIEKFPESIRFDYLKGNI